MRRRHVPRPVQNGSSSFRSSECPCVMLGFEERVLERRSLARNEVLFRQGQKVEAIYFVQTGRLRLERRTFDRRQLVLGTTSAGKFFVEAALFADIFHCDAVATEPSEVSIYPKDAVLKALRADPENALSFLSLVAHQVIELRHRLEVMKVRSAKERVMLYLDLNAGPDGRTATTPEALRRDDGLRVCSGELPVTYARIRSTRIGWAPSSARTSVWSTTRLRPRRLAA